MPSSDSDDAPDVSEDERDALHDLQVGIEYVYRAYGNLLAFLHDIAGGMATSPSDVSSDGGAIG